jgi:hypothetical protein
MGWTQISEIGAPTYGDSALWTGTQMLVWGMNGGGLYDPASDSWAPVTSAGEPSLRQSYTATWTGIEMIVIGGIDLMNHWPTDEGVYAPSSDSWSLFTGTHWLGHSAIFTGTDTIVFGGQDYASGEPTGAGARYASGSGVSVSIAVGTAVEGHTAVWTGSEMLIAGGWNHDVNSQVHFLSSGAAYNPVGDGWRPLNAPLLRDQHTSIWTGTEMISWGGFDGVGPLATGYRINPTTNVASPVSSAGAPSPRNGHLAIWTGSEMVVWGGHQFSSLLNDGAIYNPATDSWRPLSSLNAPANAGSGQLLVWTGREIIAWGAHSGARIHP